MAALQRLLNFRPNIDLDSIDVRQRRDTAAPPFGLWNPWIGLAIGASRCMAVIPMCVSSLILGRSWQTLAGFYFSQRFGGNILNNCR